MNVDKAVRYHRLKRRAAVGATLVTTVVLLALVASPASLVLRQLAAAAAGVPATGVSSPLTIAIYVLRRLRDPASGRLAVDVLQRRAPRTPLRALDRVHRPLGSAARSKPRLVLTVVAIAGSEFVYFTIRRWPDAWWIAAALGCGGALLLIAQVAPVALLPLFYRFKPLDRPQLQERLRALSERAGVPVLGAYEWALGDQTHRANAALVGVGATRRILLSDTLLADYSDDEIEVILAHELGHHAYRDMLTAVAVQTAVLVAAFYAVRFGVRRHRAPWHPHRWVGTRRRRRVSTHPARGRRRVVGDGADHQWPVASARTPRRRLRAPAYRTAGGVHLGDATTRRAEPGRAPTLTPRPVAFSLASARRGANRASATTPNT